MAEFLVKARANWMESLTEQERIDRGLVDKYNRRGVIGDIIVVKPNGWKWGKLEGPPGFVVLKVPNMSMEDAKKYEERLTEIVEEDGKEIALTRKKRKYQLPSIVVDNAKNEVDGVLQLTKTNVVSQIITKAL